MPRRSWEGEDVVAGERGNQRKRLFLLFSLGFARSVESEDEKGNVDVFEVKRSVLSFILLKKTEC